MNEIICPHCEKAFKIDEAGYADILKQIRNKEFDKELHEKLAAAEQAKRAAIELVEAKHHAELQGIDAEKTAQITDLRTKLDASEQEKKFAIAEATNSVEKERDGIKSEFEMLQLEKQLGEASLKEKFELKLIEC